MTFKEFNKKYEWLEQASFEEDMNIVECMENQLQLCRNFFKTNRDTLNDRELARVLFRYVHCLMPFSEGNGEMVRIVNLREKVCQRLARQSFEEYGEEWAGALYDKAVQGNLPDSLEDYNASIAILERLMWEFGRKCELVLAGCCYHAAVDCDCHELYENALEYIERALDIYQREEDIKRNDVHTIGLCQKIAANALTKLGRYDEAENCVEKAEEALIEWGQKYVDAGCTVIRDITLGECKDIREEIREHREKTGTTKHNKQ